MLKGCLLLLAILEPACPLEDRELDRRDLREPWIASACGFMAWQSAGAARPAPSAEKPNRRRFVFIGAREIRAGIQPAAALIPCAATERVRTLKGSAPEARCRRYAV